MILFGYIVIFLYLTLYKAEQHFYPLKTKIKESSNHSNGPSLRRRTALYKGVLASAAYLSDTGSLKIRMDVEPCWNDTHTHTHARARARTHTHTHTHTGKAELLE